MKTVKGGCLCGAVRYELTEVPRAQVVCHCKNCQKQAGTAFSVLVASKASDFQLTGEPALYVDRADSGADVNRYFCPRCGSPLYSALPPQPEMVFVKAGTLDDTSELKPQAHIWCDSAWPWTPFPEGAIKIGKNPPPRR
jgi:hypothetical protein